MFGSNQHHEEEEGGDDEIWLMSYSDMMTLLFGFFVLMYVFASTKTGDAEKVREGLAKSFGGTYVPPYEELAEEIQQQAADEKADPIMSQIDIQQPKDGMEITFRSNLLFRSGSAKLLPNVQKTMKMIAGLISKSVDNAEIFVGGHTDDVPISTRIFPSNWELSGARASSVVRQFIKSGYDSKAMVAVGYADSRPAYPNRDEKGVPIYENREKNRRVVIKVVAPGIVKQPTNQRPDGKSAPVARSASPGESAAKAIRKAAPKLAPTRAAAPKPTPTARPSARPGPSGGGSGAVVRPTSSRPDPAPPRRPAPAPPAN